MKRAASIVPTVLFFLVFFAGMGVLLHVSKVERHGISCKELEVSVPGPHQFLSEDQIRASIDNFYGIYVGQRLEDVNIGSIEKMLEKKPEVRNAEVWITDDGVLHALVQQRDPVMRFDYKGNGYYTDRGGYIFPLSGDYVAEVPVISCDPKLGFDQEWLSQAIALVRKISGSNVWSSRISGYAVETNGDFVLLGDGLKIIYGDFKESPRKFAAMEKYFSSIAPLRSEDPYHSVNVKYKGQIICRKDL